MSMSPSVTVVLGDDPMRKETIAVAGFLVGYCGSSRRSYATDPRDVSITAAVLERLLENSTFMGLRSSDRMGMGMGGPSARRRPSSDRLRRVPVKESRFSRERKNLLDRLSRLTAEEIAIQLELMAPYTWGWRRKLILAETAKRLRAIPPEPPPRMLEKPKSIAMLDAQGNVVQVPRQEPPRFSQHDE